MEEIRKLLTAEFFQPVTYGKGASNSEIQRAEAELSLTFPEHYRTFLRMYGWIKSPYISVFGLGSDADAYDIVENTKWERKESGLSLPLNLVPIVNDGAGNLYCLDVARMENSECPVVFWDHESSEGADQIPTKVAADFLTWIINEINELGS